MPFIDNFADAESHLSRKHALRTVDAACFELDGLGAHALTVRVEVLEARGRSWLAIAAAVCSEPDSDPGACLRHNAMLVVGGLAIDTDTLWMRTVVPLATTAEALDDAVDYVLEQAHTLLPQRASAGLGAFDHHGE